MAVRVVPFGGFEGFTDLPIVGAHFYSQNLIPSMLGMGTLYSIVNQISSGDVSGMGNIKHFAIGPGGALFAQDNAGHILKEGTPGSFDFTIVHSPGGNGAGLMGDQYGNLLYSATASNNQLGIYDGTTWTDSYQSLTSWQHPMDTYEDLRLFGNKNNVAVLFSDSTYNASAFSLPSSMTVDAIRSGPTGILIGANFGQRGALMVWDGNASRAKYPWKWTNGNILSITTYGENWIVKTTREVLITNGVTVKQVFTVLDDPLATVSYSTGNDSGLTEQMLIVNDFLIFAVPRQLNGPTSYEFGKMKPGLYLYSLSRHTWSYIPVPTYNTATADVYSVFADSAHSRILIGYKDGFTGTSYIGTLEKTPPSRATFVSEPVGVGRIKYQRVFFGPTDKSLEAAILNLGILNSLTDPPTETFTVSMKAYNFTRPLWGKQVTNASVVGHNDQIQVDGTNTDYTTAQVGDEVTILDGANAGEVAHISSIASPGTSSETWTLDTALPNETENSVHLQIQPFVFIEKKTFTDLSKLKRLYFDVKQGIRGNQFLLKFVFENIGTNLQLELQTSYWVFNDLGYSQT